MFVYVAVWLACVAPLRLLSATLIDGACSCATKRGAGDWPQHHLALLLHAYVFRFEADDLELCGN